MCCLLEATDSKPSVSKERVPRREGGWARAPSVAEVTGTVPPAGSRSPLVTRGPVRPPPARTHTLPAPANQELLSTHEQPLLGQEICSLSASILGVWTQPWNFTSLGGIGRGSVLCFAPASPPHNAPVLGIPRTEAPCPTGCREASAPGRQAGGTREQGLHPGGEKPAPSRGPLCGERLNTLCSQSVWSELGYPRRFPQLALGQHRLTFSERGLVAVKINCTLTMCLLPGP